MAKIIVIEDEAELRQLLVDDLEDAGHDVLEAGALFMSRSKRRPGRWRSPGWFAT